MNVTAGELAPPSWAVLCRDLLREICCSMPMQMSSPLVLPEEDRIRDLPRVP